MSNAAGAVLLGSDLTFGVGFGLFVAALVALAFLSVRWAVRRDRPGREAWRQRMIDQQGQAGVEDRS